jgi:Mn2+/Fe2+ NRAMP family transporter
VALFGTTISPYLFFWQAALMVEDEKRRGKLTIASRQGATKAEVADALADVNVGMTASNLAAFFIIVTTAATLGAHGIRNIETAQEAALALRPLAGQYAYLLFALGMVGTGLLAVPVLAGSSAYIVAEMFGFREGLDLKFRKAHGFYGVIIGSVLMAVLMSVFGTNPIRALFWAAVVNGVVAVPLLVVLTHICNRSDIMGRWTNSRTANFWAIVTIAVMATAAVLMFVFWNA